MKTITKTGESGATRLIVDVNVRLALLYVLSDEFEPDIPANSMALVQRDAAVQVGGDEPLDALYLVTTKANRNHVGWLTFRSSELTVHYNGNGTTVPLDDIENISPIVHTAGIDTFRIRDHWPPELQVAL